MNGQLQAWSHQLQPWAWNLIVVGCAIILGFVVKFIITGILHFYKNTTDYSLFRSIISHLDKPLNYFVPLLALNFMVPLLLLSKPFIDGLDRTTDILIVIAFAALLISTVKIFEDYVYHLYDLTIADNLVSRKVRTQVVSSAR